MSALAAGAIGSLITIGVGFAARVSLIPREAATHDRLAADRDADLLQWVPDRDVRLRRELQAARAQLAARGILSSGEYGFSLALLKEAALQEYRDQEAQALRDIARIYDAEGSLHGAWRTIRTHSRYVAKTPAAVRPVLDAWRADLTRGGVIAPINDPTARSIKHTVAALEDGFEIYE